MKLYESLFILSKCCINIKDVHDHLLTNKRFPIEQPGFTLSMINAITLETTIFFEEIGNFKKNIEPEFHTRMEEFKKIIKPIRQRIYKWEIDDFRNTVIAHPLRDKHGNFVQPDRLNIPKNTFDTFQLAVLMEYIYVLLKVEFQPEITAMHEYLWKQIPPPRAKQDYSTVNPDHLKMADEVGELCKKYNRPYYLKVYQYIRPGESVPADIDPDTVINL